MDETTQTGQQADDAAAASAAAAAAAADNPSSTADPFAALGLSEEQKDIRDWITKTGFKGPQDLAKTAYEQQKLLGNSIRIPGENATDEERAAYLDKLGRPKEAKDYTFAPPKELPDGLPYDGERADAFKTKAHELGLTKAQAANLHDWFVGATVDDYTAAGSQQTEKQMQVAKTETEKLVKLWGPLDGDQMKTNLAFADKALREVGGNEALAEFQRVGLIGKEGKVIQSAAIATMLSKLGAALYTEDQVLRGRADRLDNPFAEGKDFNLTKGMEIIRSDRATALTLIAAAGKKPSDFGLS